MSARGAAGRRTDWRTPAEVFSFIQQGIVGSPFVIDVAADRENHLCEKWYGPGSPFRADALEVLEWPSPWFANPPYISGASWRRWLQKFVEQGAKSTGVALLPAAVGTRWWADYVKGHADIIFFTGRVQFWHPLETGGNGNHDSALAIYGPGQHGRVAWVEVPPVDTTVVEQTDAVAINGEHADGFSEQTTGDEPV